MTLIVCVSTSFKFVEFLSKSRTRNKEVKVKYCTYSCSNIFVRFHIAKKIDYRAP